MKNQLNKSQMRHSLACALMSRVAYAVTAGDRQDDITELSGLGYSYIASHAIGGTEFAVAQSKGEQIIAIRGSSSIADLIDNLKSQVQTPTPFGRVGSGFEDYSEPIIDEVMSLALMSTRRVTFTGHSLGGAAALYLTAAAYHTEYERVQVITFGCPRVGDLRFAWNINRLFPHPYHQRWVHANDIVTKLPWQFGRFRHSNALQYITVDGQILTSPSMLQVFLDRWGYFRNSPFKWASDQFADHPISSYIRIFEGLET